MIWLGILNWSKNKFSITNDIVLLDLNGNTRERQLEPSSEQEMTQVIN